jgi:hypothetical protein
MSSLLDAHPVQTVNSLTPPSSDHDQNERNRQECERKDRQRIALHKRTGLFGSDTRGAVIKRATTYDELSQAYRLVHDTFVESGYILPHPTGTRLRIYEASPEMATFIAKVGSRVVGVLSIYGDSPILHLPGDSVFHEELENLRWKGAKLSEVTNQAVAADYRKSAISTELIRAANAHGLYQHFDEAIAIISPGHMKFYNLLGFREIGPVRSYSSVIDDPVGAMSMDFGQFRIHAPKPDEVDEFIWKFMSSENPYLDQVKDWHREARSHFLNADLLRHLFVEEGRLKEYCSPAQITMLRYQWGPRLFDKVFGRETQYYQGKGTGNNLAPIPSPEDFVADSAEADLVIA